MAGLGTRLCSPFELSRPHSGSLHRCARDPLRRRRRRTCAQGGAAMPFRGLRTIALLWGILVSSVVPITAQAAVSVSLLWTAPGDDGNTGIATTYDLRYSTQPITAASFAQAATVVGEPAPRIAGSLQFASVSGLTPNTTYYFALKTADERGNWSPISNIAVATGALVGITARPDHWYSPRHGRIPRGPRRDSRSRCRGRARCGSKPSTSRGAGCARCSRAISRRVRPS